MAFQFKDRLEQEPFQKWPNQKEKTTKRRTAQNPIFDFWILIELDRISLNLNGPKPNLVNDKMRAGSVGAAAWLILVVCHSAFASSSSNWLTKSLDYFAYEKCSYLEKSDLNGAFYKCLQQPKRDRRAAAGFGDFGSFSDFTQYIPKQPAVGGSAGSNPVKTGSEHSGTGSPTGGFNMIPDFASKYQQQPAGKASSSDSSPGSSYGSKYYESSDRKYPINVCR